MAVVVEVADVVVVTIEGEDTDAEIRISIHFVKTIICQVSVGTSLVNLGDLGC